MTCNSSNSSKVNKYYISLYLLGLVIFVYIMLNVKFPDRLKTFSPRAILKRTDTDIMDRVESARTENNETTRLNLKQFHLQPYNPNLPTDYRTSKWSAESWKQAMPKFIISRLKGKRNGFFIECGAFDGVFISNTLLLERRYNWTGLLVEADPQVARILKRRNRKAWIADVCLSPMPTPVNITMKGAREAMGHGYINNSVIAEERQNRALYPRKFKVECYPLDVLLDAVGVTEVDYFSLDVEGVELDILRTIPWDKYFIELISIEVRPGNKDQIQQYLESVGYEKIKEIVLGSDMIHDHVYERERQRQSAVENESI